MAVSGTPLSPWASSTNAADNAKRFIERLNCYRANSPAVLRLEFVTVVDERIIIVWRD